MQRLVVLGRVLTLGLTVGLPFGLPLGLTVGLPLVVASCQPRPSVAPPGPAPAAPPPVASAPQAPAAAPDEPIPLGPLPAGVRPTRETLALDIDPARDRFSGTADIALHTEAPRRVIWLHGRGLSVRSATIERPGEPAVAARWEEVDPTGVVRVTLAAPVAGDAVLRVAFDAVYDPQLVGVYRVNTAVGPAVFSKFEAIYARRAFPCFDEPAFKIPFDVALTVPAAAEVLGNMPVAETAPAGDRKRVRFAATPPLPSYLVAFAVGPFERRETVLPANELRPAPLPIGAVALRGRGNDTGYALTEERALLAAQERYFGLAFPFPKLDLVAVPDFQSGAMENAGAITFRDSRLLIDDKVSSLTDRVATTSVIAHETAHQWFGDFVTMPWWNDIWLNEGFATFLDTLTLRAVRPELEAELAAAYATDGVMNVDGLATARRIRQPIETSHDITNAFDGITYEKGAAVLTMLEHFVGDEPFRRGLHDFLASHASGNATTDDLIRALSAAAKRDLAPLVSGFLDQPGVPVVSAAVHCDGGHGRVELAQATWRAAGAVAAASDAHWQIPVCLRYGVGARSEQLCSVLDAPRRTVELPVCPDWVMPNADAAGYYRSTLAAPDLARLRDRGTARLSTVERVALGHDLEAAFASAALPGADVLRAVEPLARDPHGAVALVPRSLFGFLDRYVIDEHDPRAAAHRAALRARIARLYAPAVAQLGWTPSPSERPWRRRFRSQLFDFLTDRIEVPALVADAARRGRRLLGLDRDRVRHADAVAPDLADVALAAAVRSGGAEVFDALVDQLTHTDDAQLRDRALTALGNAREPALVGRALDLALDPRLRKNERLVALRGLLDDAATRATAWTWLTTHFDALVPLLPDRFAGRIPAMLRLCDAARIDEARAFFAPRIDQLTGGPRLLAQALESGAQCAAKVAAQRDSVLRALDAH